MDINSRKSSRILLTLIVLYSWTGFRTTYGQDRNSRNIIPSKGATKVATLQQNWSDVDARWFYNVPQGSKLIPYDWFLNLEQPDAAILFSDNSHLQSLGYLARTPDEDNIDGLPVGFVRDGRHLGMTCAACHTSTIRVGTTDYLVDGNPTHGDFETFLRRLVAALDQTNSNAAKFQRFADRVLGPGASDASKQSLQQSLQTTLAFRKGYNDRNLPKSDQPGFGPGRVDAFGAIMNEVTSTFAAQPMAFLPADAPVSYPFLWDTPQHDNVQWNGAAPNTDSLLLLPLLGTIHVGALGRNAGEVLGVFGEVDASSAGLLGISGYPSSVRKDHLIQIEDTVARLWSPLWPADFGTIESSDFQAGKALFHTHCFDCHNDTFPRTSPTRTIQAKIVGVQTDQNMAKNFAQRTSTTGLLQGRIMSIPGFSRFGPEALIKDMLVHTVQRVVIGPSGNASNPSAISATAPQFAVRGELKLDQNRSLSGEFKNLEFDPTGKVRSLVSRQGLSIKTKGQTLVHDLSSSSLGRFATAIENPNAESFDLANRIGTKIEALAGGTRITFDEPVEVDFAYKGRPLNGIWSTAPYLHNGSVPTLDELLKHPDKRIKKFNVGSWEFDTDNVGFKSGGPFEFDTTVPGNSNLGHDYSKTLPPGKTEFSGDERRQLIAYMKSL